MEIFLGIVVVMAVVIFGALISMGNERQRKAIDELREQVTAWAVQDIRIKREKVKQEIKIGDPMQWLNQKIAEVYGEDLGLTLMLVVGEAAGLLCSGNEGLQIVISPLSKEQLFGKKSSRLGVMKSGLSRLSLEKKAETFELSVLNAGVFFDIEAGLVWQKLTGKSLKTDKLTIYFGVQRKL